MNKFFFALLILIVSGCTHKDLTLDYEYSSEPCLIPTKDNKFKLCGNLIVYESRRFHVIPRGFKTDLASIPRVLWPVFSPKDYDTITPAILHDWHYCCTKVPRQKADELFYTGLLYHGMSPFKASLYYYGVRAFGWYSYRNGEGIAEHHHEFSYPQLLQIEKVLNNGLESIP